MDGLGIMATRPARLHGLDALRGGALVLGIVLHGLLPFAPGQLWLVNDRHEAAWVIAVIGPIHMFRMILFLMIAGFLGRGALARRGTWGYVRDRFVRLVVPLMVFVPLVVFPLAAFAYVDAARRGVELAPPADAGIPLGQLWFLWVLFECVVVMAAMRWGLRRLALAARMAAFARRCAAALVAPGGLVLAAAPYALSMVWQRSTGGIVEPYGLVPEPAGLLGYGGAFAVGWVLASEPTALSRLKNSWPVHLTLAVVCSVGTAAEPEGVTLPVVVACWAVGGWAWVYALTGLALRFLDTPRPRVRYLADASYWMYLLHLPLLLAFELPVAGLGWPVAVKIALAWLPAVAVMLLSYHFLVRSTWLGAWLNGRRYPGRDDTGTDLH